jgi:hypothetical protein
VNTRTEVSAPIAFEFIKTNGAEIVATRNFCSPLYDMVRNLFLGAWYSMLRWEHESNVKAWVIAAV